MRSLRAVTKLIFVTVCILVDAGQVWAIGDRILEKERKREFELSRSDRFRYRTRYFTDSGVIGS